MNLTARHSAQAANCRRHMALHRTPSSINPNLASTSEVGVTPAPMRRSLRLDHAGMAGERAEALILVIMGLLSAALVPMLIVAATLNPYSV